MITETTYQELLEPFRRANIMFPRNLEEFYQFIRQEPDPDATQFEEMTNIIHWLLSMNQDMYPDEVENILRHFRKQI